MLLTLVLGFVATACGLVDRDPAIVLGIENDTDLELTISVNGTDFATLAPRAVQNYPSNALEARLFANLPWSIAVTTMTGRRVARMEVGVGEVTSETGADGVVTTSGEIVVEDLPCGRIIIWAGTVPPSIPVPEPRPRVPCDP